MASILAISASQSGPVHSFIIGEALQAAAAQAGHTLGLKVISHLGEQGWFSDSDLASADVALVVADGPVDLSGLPESLRIVESTPQAVFDDAAAVIAQAVRALDRADGGHVVLRLLPPRQRPGLMSVVTADDVVLIAEDGRPVRRALA